MGSPWHHLNYQRDIFLSASLASNSVSTYRTGINHYRSFCSRFSLPPFPLREHIIENFCVFLHPRVAYKSIKIYLSGVQYWSKIHGYMEEIKEMPRLHYVLMGIRRTQGNSRNKPPRPPITWALVCKICAYINNSELPYDRDMLTSAVLVAFFGLLRVSEYTSPSSVSFDPSAQLMANDVSFLWSRKIARINIKKSKTDPFRQGVIVRIGMVDHELCPVLALSRFLVHRGECTGAPVSVL